MFYDHSSLEESVGILNCSWSTLAQRQVISIENKLTKAAVEKNSIPPFEFKILTLTPLFFNQSH